MTITLFGFKPQQIPTTNISIQLSLIIQTKTNIIVTSCTKYTL